MLIISAYRCSPRYLVENDNTGKVTGHKADSLSPTDSRVSKEQQEILQDFQSAVNMTVKELAEWLPTKASKSVGQKDDDGEAIGHKSGKKIIDLLNSNADDYTEDDYSHMKKVISYVHRHLAQKPSGDIENSR
ncbi:MAG: DUF3140 domain-containing protein, partial [Cyanobacteria bacterium J06649_11]